MEGAINSTTKNYILAWSLELDPSYQFPKEEIWYAEPNVIESYDKEKVKDIRKVEVRYRKGTDKIINRLGTEYSIAPCFFIPNKTELGINLIPESKEHKMCKNWVYNRIKNKKLEFIYSSVHRPWDYDNKITLLEMDVDYNKVGIEITIKNNRTQRADIIIPFKNFSKIFGAGIVIEIQFSKQLEETTIKRNNEYAFKGYSVCWLEQEDFEDISEELIELKEDKLILEPVDKILNEFSKKNSDDLRILTQNLSRAIDKKMSELNYPFCIGECKVCGLGYMTKKKIKNGYNKGNYFYSCSNWKGGCNHSINIPNDTD